MLLITFSEHVFNCASLRGHAECLVIETLVIAVLA